MELLFLAAELLMHQALIDQIQINYIEPNACYWYQSPTELLINMCISQ